MRLFKVLGLEQSMVIFKLSSLGVRANALPRQMKLFTLPQKVLLLTACCLCQTPLPLFPL